MSSLEDLGEQMMQVVNSYNAGLDDSQKLHCVICLGRISEIHSNMGEIEILRKGSAAVIKAMGTSLMRLMEDGTIPEAFGMN